MRHQDGIDLFARGVGAAAFVLLAGCAGDTPESPDTPSARSRTAAVDLTIGREDGDEAYVFGRISGLAIDGAGRIYVLDQSSSHVRVFDSTGRHVETIGRAGAGPGELRDACCLAIGPDARLWVRDNGNNRYISFELDADRGAAGPSMRMAHTDVNRWAELTFDGDGRLIDIGSRFDEKLERSVTHRFHLPLDVARTEAPHAVPVPEPPEGAVAVARIPYERGDIRGIRYVYQPYGPMHLLAHGPGGVFADAISGTYSVQVRASDGTVTRTIAVPGAVGPLLTDSQRTAGDSNLTRVARFVGKSPSELPFTVPERNTPLNAIRFDDRGRLWVFLSVPPGSPRVVHVYDTAGTHVETVELPAGVSFDLNTTFRGDRIVATMTDSLDVPHVVRLRMR